MKLPPEQHEQLLNEQLKGGKAQHAYNEFIKDFCAEKQKILWESFRALALTDTENLMEVKRMAFAVDQLETDITTVIETGRLASTTLNEHEVKH